MRNSMLLIIDGSRNLTTNGVGKRSKSLNIMSKYSTHTHTHIYSCSLQQSVPPLHSVTLQSTPQPAGSPKRVQLRSRSGCPIPTACRRQISEAQAQIVSCWKAGQWTLVTSSAILMQWPIFPSYTSLTEISLNRSLLYNFSRTLPCTIYNLTVPC
jgi:hypothetical protein